MALWRAVSPLLMLLAKRAWASLFGKRNRALIPVEADRTVVKAGGVIFDLPTLRSFGVDETRRTLSLSDGRSVVEVLIDDITELSITFAPREIKDV